MPHRRTRRVLLLAPATLLLLAGCSVLRPDVTSTATVAPPAAGGDASTSASGAPAAGLTTACQLLTKAEAEAVVGVSLSPGAEGDPGDPSCTYQPDPSARTAQVTVTTGDGAKNVFDVDSALEHEFTDVPGIADEAHREDFAIYFRKGDTWAGVAVVLLDDASTLDQRLADAARLVASRLP